MDPGRYLIELPVITIVIGTPAARILIYRR